jgi:hypothetical protein
MNKYNFFINYYKKITKIGSYINISCNFMVCSPKTCEYIGHIYSSNKNSMLSNNDILKKLRVALSLRNDDIIEILSLVDFEMSKGALGDLFRNEDHPGFVEAGDQVLRNFLNGLIIYKRGKLPDNRVINKDKEEPGNE